MTIAADVGDRPPSVRLRVRGPVGDDELSAVRQQLAACLCSGVTHISVHVGEQDDLDMDVLQALHGAAKYLGRRGGSLTVVDAGPRVLARIAVCGLDDLLRPVAGAPHTSRPQRSTFRIAAPPPQEQLT